MSTRPSDAGSGDASALAAAEDRRFWRVSLSIGAATGVASLSFNFWWPFMPLYLLDLGATSDADAVFWVALASTTQGITRLVTGPIWGVLSDRFGRKIMLLRALYFATGTTLIGAVMTEPWQALLVFGFQGIFSGFVPASVALASVSVPDSRLNSSLSIVTGAQYLGSTLGPAIGAALALVLGFRGAIFVAALLPSIIATIVLFTVPADRVELGTKGDPGSKEHPKLEPFKMTFQLGLAIFLSFLLFALTQLVRVALPIALKQIESENVEGIVGVAFTLGGLASSVAVLLLARRYFGPGKVRKALVVSSVLTGLAHVVLAAVDTVPLFVAAFALISLLEAAMIPASNTLIAANASRARRGTAFGVASSAQAIAFIAGPMAAALFTAWSLDLGFLVLGGLFLGLALLLALALREPSFGEEPVAVEPEPPAGAREGGAV